MPLDPSIIGSFRPPEVMSPVNAMAQMYQLRALQGESEKNQLAMEKSRRDMERENTMRNLLARAGTDSTAAVNALRGGGYHVEAAELSKKSTEADKLSFEADQERTKSAVAALGAAKSVLPNVRSLGDAETWVTGLYSNGPLKVVLDNAGFPVERSLQIARDAWANGKGPEWLADQAMGGEQISQSLMAQSVFGTTKPGTQAGPPVTGEAVATGSNELRAPAVVTTDSELAGLDAQIYRAQRQGNVPLVKQLTDDRNKILDERKESRPLTREQKREYGIPPGKIAWFDKQGNLHVEGGVSVNVGVDLQGNAEQKARGEMLVDDYKEIAKVARGSQKLLTTLDTQQKVLDEGFRTGFGTGVQKAAASLLGALGVPEAEKHAADSEKFLSAAQQVVLQRQQEQKGQQTEGDRQVIQDTVANLGNTVEANKFIIAVARAVAKRDIEERQFYDNWYRKEKSYDRAADAWLAGEGSKSIFDRPELAKYKKAAPAAPGRSGASAKGGTFMGFEK